MKKTFLLFSLFVSHLFAQNEATTLIKQVISQYDSYKNYEIVFEYDNNNEAFGLVDHSEGKAIFQNNQVFALFKGDKVYQTKGNLTLVNDDSKEIKVFDNKTAFQQKESPEQFFNFFKKNHTYEIEEKEGNTITLRLTPTDPETFIEYVNVKINTESKHIISYLKRDLDGTIFQMKIQETKINQALQPNLFQVNTNDLVSKGYRIL